MSGKTIFIIVTSVLVTIILMNNTEEIDFWLFGVTKIPKLVVLGTMFGLGFIFGVIAARPKSRINEHPYREPEFEITGSEDKTTGLSDEDRDYIS